MGSIPMSSNKSGWKGELVWSYSGGYVTVTMNTWKTDGYPSSAPSGANFTAKITIGTGSKTFSFQQQDIDMTVGTYSAYVSGNQVYISGQVDAPYGVSMYGNPLSGGMTVTLYEEPEEPEEEWVEPSTITLNPETVQMGGVLNISIARNSTLCTHILKYRVVDSSDSPIEIESAALTSYAWKVPDLMQWCTDALSVRVEILCITEKNGYWMGQETAEVTVTVPAATKPTCPSTATMGSSLAITLERKSGGYTHDLSYSLAGISGEIATGAGASHSWMIPLELAKAIPLLTKGTCTITCVTYNGALEVGRETVTVSLTVPDNDLTKPKGTMKLSPSGGLAEQFAGMFIRGRTGVTAEFTASSEYSQVDRYQLIIDGVTVNGNPATSAYLNSHGEVTVTGRIIDARGYARDITQVIAVIAYDKPKVIPYTGESNVVAVRCNLDGTRNPKGQHLLIRAGRKYTALNTGDGQLNFCNLSFRYKTAAAEEYSDLYTLIAGENLEGDYVQAVFENAVPDLKTGYTVQVQVSDTLSSYSVITVPVAALTIPFHIGKGSGNVAVGKYCDYSRSNAFEVGFTTYFDTGIAMREIFSESEWAVATDLGSSVADADASAVQLYTLFMAVCEGQPVWLMKLGSSIYGNGVKMTMEGSALTLNTAPAAVTALYAVL